MPISEYLGNLRQKIGSALVLVPGVAAIIHNEAGDVLLETRSDNGQWSLPAGAIDPGETPCEAVIREVWEETGLHVVPRRVVGVFGGPDYRVTYPNGDEVEYTVVVFACDVIGGELSPLDGESAALVYVNPDALSDLGLPYPPEIFHRDLSQHALFQA